MDDTPYCVEIELLVRETDRMLNARAVYDIPVETWGNGRIFRPSRFRDSATFKFYFCGSAVLGHWVRGLMDRLGHGPLGQVTEEDVEFLRYLQKTRDVSLGDSRRLFTLLVEGKAILMEVRQGWGYRRRGARVAIEVADPDHGFSVAY